MIRSGSYICSISNNINSIIISGVRNHSNFEPSKDIFSVVYETELFKLTNFLIDKLVYLCIKCNFLYEPKRILLVF